MLTTKNLCVGYDKKIIVSDVDLEICSGKILTLIGPNGSGKSTILKTITRQLKKLGGKISLCEKNYDELKDSEIAKQISMVMTEKINPEKMTCRDVVASGRYPYTGYLGILNNDDWKKVEDAIKLVHGEEVAEKEFSKISDGQKQRIMLARAICQDTDLIILDEPTSYLDMFYKLDLMKTIHGLAKSGKAILMSLHELDLVKMISDEIVCVNENRIIKKGSVDEIFSGDFIQRLYGIKSSEFDNERAAINLDCVRDWNGSEAVAEQSGAMERACANGTMESPPVENGVRESDGMNEGNAQKNKTKILMVQGTMSNAGKSLLVAGLCRIFMQDGFRVKPFKSQNMALNSFITKNGLEMGRAQVMQAEACGIEPNVFMNPILLKPTSDKGSQVIVNGEVLKNMEAKEYFKYKKNLIPEIKNAFCELKKDADIIVIEGAGSPAEINLRENDIVNMGLAKMLDAPVLLVGDIDRGGVFAQLVGTIDLLNDDEKKLIQGLVINKFRGDKSLLDSGIEMLEKKCGKKVCGVIPYLNICIDDEDSLSNRFEKKENCLVNIGVIKFPRISNFSDFSVFEQIENVVIHYISNPNEIEKMDMIILPGSKNTIADLKWMRENGIEAAIKKFSEKKLVFGICGGFQMLGNFIEDPFDVEEGGVIRGMELLDTKTVLEKNKVRKQISYELKQVDGVLNFLSNKKIEGYEIHNGKTFYGNNLSIFDAGVFKNNIYGTYVHGFFDNDDIAFCIAKYLAEKKGANLNVNKSSYKKFKESQYDILADEMRKNLDMEAIYGMLRESSL